MKIYTSEMIKKVNIRNKKINFVLRFIYIPIIMLILALGATIFYQVLVLNKSNVEILGYKAYVVMSERTEPYLKNGDVVISKKILENDIKVGDIITFKSSNNRPIVTNMIEQIIQKDGKIYYQIKDNNPINSELIEYSNIQEKVVFRISKIGFILTKFLTGTGFASVIIFLYICYQHTALQEDKIVAREDARKKYNVCRYKRKETYDNF